MDQEKETNTPEVVDNGIMASPLIQAAPTQVSPVKEKFEVSVVRKENEKVKPTLSKDESKRVSSEIWARVFKHYGWLIVAVFGGMGFGAIFPGNNFVLRCTEKDSALIIMEIFFEVWGLLLAHSQNTLYLTDTNQMKEEAAVLAYYYIALAFAALISSTFEFW